MQSYNRTTDSMPAVSAERIPPQALDVERTVLGSMLIDGQAASAVFESLDERAFYASANRRIFVCMQEMFEKSIPIDLVTLTDILRKKGWLEAVGEEPYLAELAESIATSANIEYYANILLEKATLRELITSSAEITSDCFTPDVAANEILDRAEAKIFGIAESRISNKFEKMSQLLPHTFKEIENYGQGSFNGVLSGFSKLDEMTTGFQKGDLIIVAGRPSMGKTSFALSIAANASIRAKTPTGIFSLEMSKHQLAQRLLCAEAKVNMHLLRSGKLPRRDYPQLSLAAGPLAEAPLFIDDTPGISVLELRAKARRLKAQYDIQLLMVDYLQLMGSSSHVESRQQEISQISRSLKGVAKELDLPLIVLSQLSRAPEQRTEHRPQLSDLRESGAIEQDADVVMFVYREEVYNHELPEEEKARSEIIIGKQRNGPIGTVHLAFIKDFAKFDTLDEYAMPARGGSGGILTGALRFVALTGRAGTSAARSLSRFLQGFYELCTLTGSILSRLVLVFRNPDLTVVQMYAQGVESFPLVAVIALFLGSETVIQAVYQMAGIVPMRYLGVLVCKSLITELGPVIISMVIAGRVATGIAAEIGGMKSSEQLDAMQVLRLDPVRYLFVPRFLACIIMVPVLVIVGEFIAFMGSIITVALSVNITMYDYLSGLRLFFDVHDLLIGVLKTISFGAIIALTGAHFGLKAKGGAIGIGNATTRAVITAAVLILIVDFIIAVLVL